MSILSWIIVGAISGWLANIIGGGKKKKGCFFNIILGIIGAFIGGYIMTFFGESGVTGFNLWSILVATLGAVLLLWVVKKISD